ncbi:MAG: hypothetical protein EA376_01365 [Phycisphaeraceae bacterium]|nr:MAG: hypothetical protein EA376_01365 [Phycisphaeraceae bacterium]
MNLTWIIPALSLTLAAAGVALLAWSLFWDRARGRKRCPKCWYDMVGAPGLVCSECGHDAGRERRLQKTRRRWRWAGVAAALLLVAAALSVVQPVRERGWVAAVPSWALVHLVPMPMADAPSPEFERGAFYRQPLWTELNHRRRGQSLWLWEERMLMGRFARAFPAELEGLIVTRREWPAGEDVWIEVHPAGWMRGVRGRILKVTPRVEGMRSAEISVLTQGTLYRFSDVGSLDIQHGIGRALANTTEIIVDLELMDFKRDQSRNFVDWGIVWRGETSIPLSTSRGVSEILTPFSSPEFDAMVRDTLSASVSLNAENHVHFVNLYGDWEELARLLTEFGDAVLPIRLELMRDGVVVAEGVAGGAAMEQTFPRFGPSVRGVTDFAHLTPRSERLLDEDIGDSHWEVRVVGDPSVALRYFNARRHWSGEAVIPVWRVDALFQTGTDALDHADHIGGHVEFDIPPRRYRLDR